MQMKDGNKRVSGTFKLLLYTTCCYLIYTSNISFAEDVDAEHDFSVHYVNMSWKPNMSNIPPDVAPVPDLKYIIITHETDAYPRFAFGFSQIPGKNSYILAVLMGPFVNPEISPVAVWCANRDHPVGEDATLYLTSEQGLVLRDGDGSLVWSTNTLNLSASSIRLQNNGNLVMLNAEGKTIWESGYHPTDTLLNFKQDLSIGQRLTSSKSNFDYSSGMYYVSWEVDGLHAYIDLDPPQEYRFMDYETYHSIVSRYIGKAQGSLTYMFLDPNGHLQWIDYKEQSNSFDLFDHLDDFDGHYGCSYPTTCGNYGICTNFSVCGCPSSSDYFQPVNSLIPSLGCSLVNPLSCPDTHKLHYLFELKNVAYFDSIPSLTGTDVDSCKSACLSNCSCKAVFFRYYGNTSFGNCTLPSEILTLMDVSHQSKYKEVAYIKLQKKLRNGAVTKASLKIRLVLPVSAISLMIVLVMVIMLIIWRRKSNNGKKFNCSLDILVDTISQFSFEDLKLATQNFQARLGRGGFGSVFEGTLSDGTKVAVKQLDSVGQGRKEFLAEVNTIGSVHHFNLVRLIGFCDDGLNRLLVYEYMCNGSLEKWIFNQDISLALTWSVRQKIIHGVAAGLEYLHTHCKQNVIHFDIKPQNILLDKDFNIKISDFGLAKMVDRDQSQVMTMVRGTPGYMAPEMVTGRAISVKVDVYSFGVLVLEIVCGRKNFGSSEGDCLTNLVKVKADEDQLSDLIDERGEDMLQHKEEAVKMMKIAIWCLQPHFIRPTMSMVVKVLQDLPNMEALSDLSYLTMVQEAAPVETNYDSAFRPPESLLSGPR